MIHSKWVSAADQITAFTEQVYPLNYTKSGDDDGQVIGFATELVIAVLDEAGLDYELKIGPWTRAVRALDIMSNVLAYPTVRTADLESKYHWIGEIAQLDYYLYGLKENVDSLPRSLEEARNYRIGVVRNHAAHRVLSQAGFEQLIVMNDPALTLDMLKRGRIDLFPFGQRAGFFAEGQGVAPDELISVAKIEALSTGLYIAVGKNTNEEYVNRLRNAYTKIRSSGKYDEIMEPMSAIMKKYQVESIR